MKKKAVVAVPSTFYAELAERMHRREPVVVVTVIEARGSAPGKAGAKMIVAADSIHGTVGGGKIENAAIQHARSILGEGVPPETRSYDVVQDLGMTCGGTMNLLYESHTTPPRLVIFGAGHLGEALCAMASLAGFSVTVCDDREDWLTEERFPAARQRILAPSEAAVRQAELDDQTFVTSVSRGHAVDEEIVRALLARKERPCYLGVIGSRRKAIELRKGLAEAGLSQEDIERIHIPMGLNLGAADPAEIAVSILAELVAELRGMNPVEPW